MTVPVPPAWPNLAKMLAAAAETFDGEVAVIDGDVELTWDELHRAAVRFGASLVAAGIVPGERVAIWAPNSVEWIISVLGVHQAAATLIPINTRFRGFESGDILRRGRARLLITTTDFLGINYVDLLREAGGELPDLEHIVVLDGPVTPGTISLTSFEAAVRDAHVDELSRRIAQTSLDSPADILFTSGTTGSPKGVLSTHAQSMAVALDWVTMTGLRRGDRYLMVNPYFHMFGLKAGIMTCISRGATMLPVRRLDVERVLELVEELAVTVLPGPPTLYQSMLDHPTLDSHDLSSLRVAVTGAADIPVELIRRIDAELPFSVVVSGYGMTEAGTVASTLHDDDYETIATTVGRPRPGFELRLVDAEGSEVSTGEVGEIVVRGPSVMSCYVDDPVATRAVLSDDRWLRTGDLGRLDPRGNLSIVGRTRDMFIVGGFNAYPAEIEAIMSRHPDVLQVGVVGIADERLGEVGMAFVVAQSELDETDFLAWCRENMANYKVPRRLRQIDQLPLNASGKVHKALLHEWAGTDPDGS